MTAEQIDALANQAKQENDGLTAMALYIVAGAKIAGDELYASELFARVALELTAKSVSIRAKQN